MKLGDKPIADSPLPNKHQILNLGHCLIADIINSIVLVCGFKKLRIHPFLDWFVHLLILTAFCSLSLCVCVCMCVRACVCILIYTHQKGIRDVLGAMFAFEMIGLRFEGETYTND